MESFNSRGRDLKNFGTNGAHFSDTYLFVFANFCFTISLRFEVLMWQKEEMLKRCENLCKGSFNLFMFVFSVKRYFYSDFPLLSSVTEPRWPLMVKVQFNLLTVTGHVFFFYMVLLLWVSTKLNSNCSLVSTNEAPGTYWRLKVVFKT